MQSPRGLQIYKGGAPGGGQAHYYPDPLCCAVQHMEASRFRNYCFTWNNFDGDAELQVQALSYRYLVYGREVGESGTPHLQGFISFVHPRCVSGVRKALKGAHVEVARAPGEAAAYCKKGAQPKSEWEAEQADGPTYGVDADIFESGDPVRSNESNGDVERARYKRSWDAAKAGTIDDEEIDPDILIRHYNTLRRISFDHQAMPAPVSHLDNWWYVGPTGSGKSRTARLDNPEHYLKNTNKWWDGYTDQPCVIIDEWGPEDGKYLGQHLKRWCDHHPFSAEVKGGVRTIRPPRIIVTSNYRLEECFEDENVLLPLQRRFQTKYFGNTAFNPAATTK